MRFHRTNTVCAVALLVTASSLQGCGDEITPPPVDPGLGSSSSGGAAGEGGMGGAGGGASSSSIASSSSSSSSSSGGGQGGMGGQGGGGITDLCGDGIVGMSEGCDDDNMQSGDGCSTGCMVESGYVCMGAPSVCADINECATNNGGCSASQMCVNTPGSFDCVNGCSADPPGFGNAVFTIGPSAAVAALCNAQTLVGNQSTNKLEVRTSTGTIGSSYSLPDKPSDIVYDVATNTAYVTLFNTMAATTDLVRVNLTTGIVTSIPIGGVGLRIALGNNGRVFVTMSDALSFPNRPIALVDGPNATLLHTFLVPYAGNLIAFDRGSNLLYLADEGASPSKLERYGFDPVGQTLTLLQSRADTGNNGVDLAISPDGLHVAFSCSQGNQSNPLDYKLHDINSMDLNAVYGIWNTGLYPTAAVFSPNNLRLMATNGTTMRRFTMDTHTALSENVLQPCTNGAVRRIAVSPGGTFTYVLTACGAPPSSGLLARIYYP